MYSILYTSKEQNWRSQNVSLLNQPSSSYHRRTTSLNNRKRVIWSLWQRPQIGWQYGIQNKAAIVFPMSTEWKTNSCLILGDSPWYIIAAPPQHFWTIPSINKCWFSVITEAPLIPHSILALTNSILSYGVAYIGYHPVWVGLLTQHNRDDSHLRSKCTCYLHHQVTWVSLTVSLFKKNLFLQKWIGGVNGLQYIAPSA